MLFQPSGEGAYSRIAGWKPIAGGKTPGLRLVEALPAEVVALGISICDTTRDGSRIVGKPELIQMGAERLGAGKTLCSGQISGHPLRMRYISRQGATS